MYFWSTNQHAVCAPGWVHPAGPQRPQCAALSGIRMLSSLVGVLRMRCITVLYKLYSTTNSQVLAMIILTEVKPVGAHELHEMPVRVLPRHVFVYRTRLTLRYCAVVPFA